MLQPTTLRLVGQHACRNKILFLRTSQCNHYSYYRNHTNFSNNSFVQFIPSMPTTTVIPNPHSSSFEKEMNILTPEIENGKLYPFYGLIIVLLHLFFCNFFCKEISNNNSSLQNLWNVEANEEIQQSVKGDEQKSTSMECDSVKRKRRRKMKRHKHRKRLKATRPLRKKLRRL